MALYPIARPCTVEKGKASHTRLLIAHEAEGCLCEKGLENSQGALLVRTRTYRFAWLLRREDIGRIHVQHRAWAGRLNGIPDLDRPIQRARDDVILRRQLTVS